MTSYCLFIKQLTYDKQNANEQKANISGTYCHLELPTSPTPVLKREEKGVGATEKKSNKYHIFMVNGKQSIILVKLLKHMFVLHCPYIYVTLFIVDMSQKKC